MKITTEHTVETLQDGRSAQLIVTTFVDGHVISRATALSGPIGDVQDFVDGKVTMEEINIRWTRSRHGVVHGKQELLKIGYWWSQYETECPRVQDFIDMKWSIRERDLVVTHLRAGKPKDTYKGSSTCRICGINNGSYDVTDGKYLWPSGFLHYIENHAVKPPQDFINHVLAVYNARQLTKGI